MQLAKRVESNRISETDYRGLRERLSYSAIKAYDNDRQKFYKEFILGEISVNKETKSTILGSLVHCFLAGANFDEKFHIASCKEPTGQMKDLVEALFTRTLQSTTVNSYGERHQNDKFSVIFADAVQKVKFDFDGNEIAFKKKDINKIMEMFEGDAEMYYKEQIECIGRTVVSIPMLESAERLVERLRGHSYTHELVNIQPIDKKIDVFNELPILFDIGEVPYKCMPDRTIIYHEDKIIEPIDWKTSWDNEDPDKAYLKFGYYIQLAMYNLGIKFWAKQHNMEDYTIKPMKFVFCDTGGFADPIILEPTLDDIERAMRGFKVRGYRYRGLNELMSDIQWHVETGNWATTKAVFDTKGKVKLTLPYGSR